MLEVPEHTKVMAISQAVTAHAPVQIYRYNNTNVIVMKGYELPKGSVLVAEVSRDGIYKSIEQENSK